MGDKWFIERQGVTYGPADVSELSQWITEGRLDWSDLLWPESADRGTAVPAYTALQALGLIVQPATAEVVAESAELLTPQVEEIPTLPVNEESFEIPILPDSLVGDQAAKAPATNDKPVPDWIKSLGEALEVESRKPRSSRPDWLEDVRQAEKAALPPKRRITSPKKDA
jgi:hypothetical protein